VGSWEADSKIESWEKLKQAKEGVPKQALQAGSAVSTLVASPMSLRFRWSFIGRLQRWHLPISGAIDEQRRGERVSAGFLQHGKRVLERLNDVQKGRG